MVLQSHQREQRAAAITTVSGTTIAIAAVGT